jgi:hypothetical protein
MLTNNTEPAWKVGTIALFAMVLAVAGGLSLFNKANDNTEPPTVIATSCSEFAADAHRLFDQGDTAALSGTFAPGDHVHLAIDSNGVGYSWKLTGALGKKPDVTSSGSYSWSRTTTTSTSTSTVSRGKISGFARLEVEIDVAKAGEGAITINKASSMPLPTSPKVVIATCRASKKAPPITRRLSS